MNGVRRGCLNEVSKANTRSAGDGIAAKTRHMHAAAKKVDLPDDLRTNYENRR
jgi:hypothetical protein